MKVTGLRDIERRLGHIEKAVTRRTVARNALKAGGKIIADTARRLAPVDDGDLRNSITVSTKLTRRQKSLHIKRDPVEIFAGAGGGANPIQQEFGNSRHGAQPYMRPAYDSQKSWALDAIVNAMEAETTKALKRQAKRNARKK